jgi:hypothetical protein
VTVLTLNGKNVPTALLKGITYTIEVLVDGVQPLYVEWTVVAGFINVASGNGHIVFTPTTAITHYITVHALKSDGAGEETITPVNVTTRRTTVPTITVQWERLDYTHGERMEAVIHYSDPEGLAYTSLSWALFLNNAQSSTGSGKTVQVPVAQYGLYRLLVTAVDATGTTIEADSTVKVSGGFEIRATINLWQPPETMVHLGDIFSKPLLAGAKTATYLPFGVASHFQEVAFISGTTHFKLALADGTSVDDEIVVRTITGNWALVGPPTGLSTEAVGYDYALPSGYILAPADYRMKAMFDVWNVHGSSALASTAVVKFQCFRRASLPVYQYTPCRYSSFPGGAGLRQRRFAVLFEQVLLEADAWGLTMPENTPPKWFKTPVPNRLIGRLAAGGEPYPVQTSRGSSMTESNLYAVYSAAYVRGDAPVEAFGVYGIPGLRPFIANFTLPSDYTVTRRVRAVRGTMAIYVASGATVAGSTLDVFINTQASPGTYNYLVNLQEVYSSDQDVFIKAGEVEVDLMDYGFSLGGIVVDMTLYE